MTEKEKQISFLRHEPAASGAGDTGAAPEAQGAEEGRRKARRDRQATAAMPGRKAGAAEGKGGGKAARKAARKGSKAAAQPTKAQAMATEIRVRPIARPAKMRRRHWGLILSFVLLVLVPLAAGVGYLWTRAVDQYSSSAGFTVRQEQAPGASDLLGGLAQFAGGGSGSDGDVLYQFIQSQPLIASINGKLDLVSHYSAPYEGDPLFALAPGATIEDLHDYWQRVVRISYDQGTGLIDLQVLAFEPEFARAVAQEIVAESQDMINALNAAAREDALRYAQGDLEEALTRLKVAREALTQFRLRTQIVDPSADLQGRMGVLNNLQQQLAQALIDYDLLNRVANDTDPRVKQAQQRIEVIRQRIVDERDSIAEEGGVGQKDYPTLIAEYESLVVDREFAEETYRAALAAIDAARADVLRQSRYLATYVQPTLAGSAEFPQRVVLALVGGLFLFLAWMIMALVYYSIRDRR